MRQIFAWRRESCESGRLLENAAANFGQEDVLNEAWDPKCVELCSIATQCCPADTDRLIELVELQNRLSELLEGDGGRSP